MKPDIVLYGQVPSGPMRMSAPVKQTHKQAVFNLFSINRLRFYKSLTPKGFLPTLFINKLKRNTNPGSMHR